MTDEGPRSSSAEMSVLSCEICGTPSSAFLDLGGGGKARRCPGCNSLERQRVLARLYPAIALKHKLVGKRILLVSPSKSEIMFLRAQGILDVTTLDIRPEVKTDLIADVCDMAVVPDSSFDVAIASYVLSCVHNLPAALSELARILKPGGVLLTSDPTIHNQATREYDDSSAITKHYGKDLYDKYRIGEFRRFGDLDIKEVFAPYFECDTMNEVDQVTRTVITWAVATSSRGGAQEGGTMAELQNANEQAPADVEEQPFKDIDLEFEQYLKTNPTATWTEFSVKAQALNIRNGRPHPSLGPKLVKQGDWWQAGEWIFNEYLRIFKIAPNSKVVDYGCGSLRVGGHFIRYLQPDSYFGLDVTTDFIAFGMELVGETLLKEKRPRLGAISPKTVEMARAFGADFVVCSSVAAQVHPDDFGSFADNLVRITSKPKATLFFDVKLAEQPFRAESSTWAWPLSYYIEKFAPLRLSNAIIQNQQVEQGRKMATTILQFTRL